MKKADMELQHCSSAFSYTVVLSFEPKQNKTKQNNNK